MEKNEEGKKKKKNDVEKIDCENNKKNYRHKFSSCAPNCVDFVVLFICIK